METREEIQVGDCGPPSAVVDDLLADERCRTVLHRLADADGPVLVDDLACIVATRESDRSAEEVTPRERQQYREELFDATLPRLTATRVVEYDSRLDAVELLDETVASRLD